MNQTKPNYAAKALFLILLAFFIGGYSANAQSKQELKGVPISESGLTAEEYTTIINHNDVVKLFSTEGILTLTLCKVYGTTNDPNMKHMFVQKDNQIKNNPNKPIWSSIPYTIIREETYNDNN